MRLQLAICLKCANAWQTRTARQLDLIISVQERPDR